MSARKKKAAETGMSRTQVYLTQDIVSGVRDLARTSEQSEAATIRALLRSGLEQHKTTMKQTASSLIGKYASGSSDTSTRVDEILYGKASR